MGLYGQSLYGTTTYGASELPRSNDFAIFDFCYPVDAVMTQLFAYAQVTGHRTYGAPNVYFDGNNDLCMLSDDGINAGFRIDTSITNNFMLQFTFISSALPDDFSSLLTSRFFVAAYNQYNKMIGVLLSADEGIALSTEGTTADILPDSADIFDNDTYYTFRLVVDMDNNRGHIYVTERDLVQYIGHQLQYSFPLQDTPPGYSDYVNIDILGTAANPTSVCLDCIRLHNAVTVNYRPVAVPGDDQTRSRGQYATFDGTGSYDPDPADIIENYWWTITECPNDADILRTGINATVADTSGYTNKVTGSAGDFSDISEGDLIIVGGNESTVMHVASDGSWLAAVDRVFLAGQSSIDWACIDQSGWDGDWSPSTMYVVLSSEDDPSLLTPSVGDAYLVLPGAIGDWLNKDHSIATWNGTAWDFTDPEDENILYDIDANTTYRYLYLPPAPPPHNGIWYANEPKPWELGHWTGRSWSKSRVFAGSNGLYIIDLIVSDGEVESIPVEVLLNVYVTDVALGLTPDLSFIWNYISDFWDLVIDKERIESIWSSLSQLFAGELLALWQHDYSKDIFSIQRTFQRQWLNYDPLYEEPDYSELPATIYNDSDIGGYSSDPNVLVSDPQNPGSNINSETAYDLGSLVAGITDSDVLVLDGVCYDILRTEDDTSTVVITKESIATGSDRPKPWMIRPTVTSRSSDFTKEGVTFGDEAIFEITNDTDVIEATCFIWGVREKVLAFDDTNIASYLADSDVTVKFKAVRRRTNILVDDLVVSVPRLQETIAIDRVEGADDPLYEAKDFNVEEVTTIQNQEANWITFNEAWFERKSHAFDGEYTDSSTFTSASADFLLSLGGVGTSIKDHVLVTEDGRFRLNEVTGANSVSLFSPSLESGLSGKTWEIREVLDSPDSLWAEVTFLDNRPTIEDNFGRLIGFTLDDLEERTDNLDYLSAVQGLWYATWFGRTLENVRIGSQILLGLPFAEVAGTIIDIKSPYDPTRDRVIVQDSSDENIVRAYYYPTLVGIADNRDTGVPLVVGDTVDQFDPLSKGVAVDDWESDPDWINPFIGSGLDEPQKIHNFLVKVSADVFDITNLSFLISFLNRIKPKYTHPLFAVADEFIDTPDVSDAFLVGPYIPESGSYPDTWPSFQTALGWASPAPNEENARVSVNRVTPSTYDSSTRWPSDRFVTPRSMDPNNSFGNLHLSDSPGRTPDSWEGSWSGLPSSHSMTKDEGSRRYDMTDESGHIIHKYDAHLNADSTIQARDGHMEAGGTTYWTQVGTPTTLQKSSVKKYTGSQSLYIVSSSEGDGAYNEFGEDSSDTTTHIHEEGFQVAVVGWVYVESGIAHLRLRDQDGSTYLAETIKGALAPKGWEQFVLHAWVGSGSSNPFRFEVLTGAAGGTFYIDAVECFVKAVPWCQVGYDRPLFGRTGGYTFGGDPDEFFQARLHFYVT